MYKVMVVLTTAFLLILLASCKTNQKRNVKNLENDSDIVFTIYSHDGKSESQYMINSLGHAWLSVENQTEEVVKFNNYAIKSGESLYFGAWGSSAKWGVCYNMEPNFANEFGRYEGTISLSTTIDLAQLNKICEFVSDNDQWNIIQNCSWFATYCWNSAMDEDVDLPTYWIYTPTSLCSDIMEFEEYQVNKPMTGAKDIFFYNENNEMEILQLCEAS